MNAGELTEAITRIVREQFPQLARGLLVARLARITAVAVASGAASTNLSPGVTVDCQPIRSDGADDADWPLVTGVRVAIPWAGAGRGVFALPAVGALVRLSWLWGSAEAPIADPYTAEGFHLPAGLSADLVIRVGTAEIRVTESGALRLAAAPGQAIIVDGDSVRLGDAAAQTLLTSAFVAHTHPTADGPTGTAIAPAGSVTTKTRAT